jgi:hypothetical protein
MVREYADDRTCIRLCHTTGSGTIVAMIKVTRKKRKTVTDTVGQMPQAEFVKMLEAIIDAAVEQKLIEILGDPDKGLSLRKDVRARLLRQQQAVKAGERGQSLEDVLDHIGVE